MYVYKKKCDEDYYLSIIQATQQQQQYMFQNNPNYLQSQQAQFNNNVHPRINTYNNPYYNPNNYNNFYNYNNNEMQNNSQLTNNKYNYNYNNRYYNKNYISPSPLKSNIYNNKKEIMDDQILYNKLSSINDINNDLNIPNFQKIRNNEYENEVNNKFYKNNFYNQNNNNFNNKKIFKLEDFLSDKKNNLNNKFNRAANESFY